MAEQKKIDLDANIKSITATNKDLQSQVEHYKKLVSQFEKEKENKN
jgi:uncharacterized protein YlxW (UPF0749 family)